MKPIISLLLSSLLFLSTTALAEFSPKLSQERVILHTNYGDIVLGFYKEVAPRHVEQILRLVKAGVYSGASFYRLEPGFVAQVENYDAKQASLTREQFDLIKKIPGEFSVTPHRRGRLSMARFGDDLNSAETSFSLMLGDAPHLDGEYTVFGEIVSGMDVLAAIEAVPADTNAKPTQDIIIDRAEIAASASSLYGSSGYTIASPKNDPYQKFFKIFAAIAFVFTVLLPLIKNILAKAPK